MDIEQFNQLPPAEARAAIESCVAIPAWQQQLVAARPFLSVQQALDYADGLSRQWQQTELAQAFSAHPRIGERASGQRAHQQASRSEQAAVLTADSQVRQAIADGNQAYEARFGRIFLIRAKGRTPQEILEHLRRRLHNDDREELGETLAQLREITLLRLQEVLS